VGLKLGANLPQTTSFSLSTDVVRGARALEEIGYDSGWAFERVLAPVDQSGKHGLLGMPDVPWPPQYSIAADPLVVLTTAAAVTTRLELGTGVLVPPMHVPLRLAKELASLDHVSGGRLIAGIGTGWSIDEYEAVAPRPIGERGAALDEFLDVAAAAWGPDPVAFTNERWSVGPARINPKPARRIPIFLGGFRPVAMRRIARRGDGWLATNVGPAQVAESLGQLRELAAEAGRDPAALDCVYQLRAGDFDEVPSQGRAMGAGSLEQKVEDIAGLAEAGVGHVYVTLTNAVKGIDEYVDRAAELHAAVRATGL
jgi:probable F420-dependent oxidoreductase